MTSYDPGKQHCVVYYLHEAAVAEYDRLHGEVWPEVLADLQERGIFDYSIFRRGNLAIGVFRVREGLSEASTISTVDGVVRKWSELMATMIERNVDDQGIELVAPRIFRMD